MKELAHEIIESFEDRRKHARLDVGPRQLTVRFSSQIQFAKQYIENISIGGLFVKTDLQASVGEEIPIEFSVPLAPNDPPQIFSLLARVARVDPDGLGLEFTELPSEARRVIEIFIKTTLPSGIKITRSINPATFERFNEKREQKAIHQRARLKTFKKWCMVAGLLILNAFVVLELNSSSSVGTPATMKDDYTINGIRFSENDIRSFKKLEADQYQIELRNGEVIPFKLQDESRLPPHLQRSLATLRALPLAEKPAINSTAKQNQIRLR